MSYLDDEQVFDKARYVEFDEHVVYVWNGGHTVNIYVRHDMESLHATRYINTDVFSVGDFAKDEASFEEVQTAIRERIEGADEDDE